MTDEDSVDTNVAREIVHYCLHNPQAAGDLEYFARWRLMEQRVHLQLVETGKALEWLVSQGLLSQTVVGEAPIFMLNAQRRADAERFVKGAAITAPPERR